MLDTLIQNKINELPKNIKQAIEKFDWNTEIMHIAHNNNMRIDDIDTFKNETLLVIVGLTSAEDFEKNLIKQLNISHNFAQKLVSEANEYIFYPLQKLAFSQNEKEENENIQLEKENISHEEISTLMNNHGIELIEEKEEIHPENKFKDLTGSTIVNEKIIEDKKNIEIEETKKEVIKKDSNTLSPFEPIREEDLVGIYGHRIDTDILNEKEDLQRIIPKNTDSIEKKHLLDINNLNNMIISREERIDVSPSKKDQISERGDFLKHIGAK